MTATISPDDREESGTSHVVAPGRLPQIQQGCVFAVGAISLTNLTAWLIPGVGQHLPSGWALVKANTALAALCSAAALSLSGHERSRRALLLSRALATFVALIVLAVIVEYLDPRWSGIDTVLAPDRLGVVPGRMSLPAAISFGLFAGIVLLMRTGREWMGMLADVLSCLLCTQVLVTASGYLFGAIQLFGYSRETVTAPQTLLCLILLAFVAFGRRAEYGVFRILLGPGIGSNIARFATPFTFALPFLLEVGRMRLQQTGGGSQAYTTAIAVSVSSMLAFGLLMVLAWRIEGLEKEIRELSLRDELTKVYNRRGFGILATQALMLARRSRVAFSVLYIDIDNLKIVNDGQGHDAGSSFIREMAELVTLSFRATDMVARLGGDEFVVAAASDATGMKRSLDRLNDLVEMRNALPNRAYVLSFSYGLGTSGPYDTESLDSLVMRADAEMYRMKKGKKPGQR